MTETSPEITQLQQQQSLFTAALAAMLEGRFTGADSVEAYLYALDPSMEGKLTLDPPVSESELEEPPKG